MPETKMPAFCQYCGCSSYTLGLDNVMVFTCGEHVTQISSGEWVSQAKCKTVPTVLADMQTALSQAVTMAARNHQTSETFRRMALALLERDAVVAVQAHQVRTIARFEADALAERVGMNQYKITPWGRIFLTHIMIKDEHDGR